MKRHATEQGRVGQLLKFIVNSRIQSIPRGISQELDLSIAKHYFEIAASLTGEDLSNLRVIGREND